jgi:hypothetical protein
VSGNPLSNPKGKPDCQPPPSQSEIAAAAVRIAVEAAGKVDMASVWPGRPNPYIRRPVRRE